MGGEFFENILVEVEGLLVSFLFRGCRYLCEVEVGVGFAGFLGFFFF